MKVWNISYTWLNIDIFQIKYLDDFYLKRFSSVIRFDVVFNWNLNLGLDLSLLVCSSCKKKQHLEPN